MDVEELLPRPPYYYQSPFISISYIIIFAAVWVIIMTAIYAASMKEQIEADWPNQRCKAGLFIGGKDNIAFCTKQIIAGVTAEATQPLTYGASQMTGVFGNVSNQLQSVRVMLDYLRNSMSNIVRDILGRTMMVIIPLQTTIITVKDVINRMIAVLTTAMYMGIATILTMKQILETIVNFVIVILISLAALIVVMWVFPFTWSAAILFTAIFVSISIPLLGFVKAVSKVTDLGIMNIPKAPHVCFDKYTAIQLRNGSPCPMFRLKLGEQLADGSFVTAKLKLLADKCKMYYLNGVLVTGSHLVKWKTTWIPVEKHPLAIRVPYYTRQYVYCINTTNGRIKVGGMTFTDWDEMLEEDFIRKRPSEKIHLAEGCKKIKNIKVGEKLKSGNIVTGVAKMLKQNRNKTDGIQYHLYS